MLCSPTVFSDFAVFSDCKRKRDIDIFVRSIGSGGPYMMSGGGRMPGIPNMFGGGGGGSMASKFGNSPMGRPQSAQMMAPNFAAR